MNYVVLFFLCFDYVLCECKVGIALIERLMFNLKEVKSNYANYYIYFFVFFPLSSVWVLC